LLGPHEEEASNRLLPDSELRELTDTPSLPTLEGEEGGEVKSIRREAEGGREGWLPLIGVKEGP